ncbi:MAG: hypothetical protein M5T61_17655 [Acidimicrobiia bacterium]|nr:hypothetical protein [Acidimicrobiia bacterium]
MRRLEKAVLGGDEAWLQRLTHAFAPLNNITDWRDHDSFLKWCKSHGADALEALTLLWSAPSASDTELEAFLSTVPDAAVSTPGARANIVELSARSMGARELGQLQGNRVRQSTQACRT